MRTQVKRLRPVEDLQIDAKRLGEMYHRLGSSRANRTIAQFMDELTNLYQQLQIQGASRRVLAAGRTASQIESLSEHLGLRSLQRVSRDLRCIAGHHDPAAWAAVLTRMDRVAERTFKALSTLQEEFG